MIITIGCVLSDDKGNEYKVIDSIKQGALDKYFYVNKSF